MGIALLCNTCYHEVYISGVEPPFHGDCVAGASTRTLVQLLWPWTETLWLWTWLLWLPSLDIESMEREKLSPLLKLILKLKLTPGTAIMATMDTMVSTVPMDSLDMEESGD